MKYGIDTIRDKQFEDAVQGLGPMDADGNYLVDQREVDYSGTPDTYISREESGPGCRSVYWDEDGCQIGTFRDD